MTTCFVAEISSNHNGDLSRAKELIASAAYSGFDVVKFQLFRVENLFSKEALLAKPFLLERKQWELPYKYLEPLKEFATSLNLKFACTPFDLEAVDVLRGLVDFYKIASYELPWFNLIEKCTKTGLPIVISTGMSHEQEVLTTVEKMKEITEPAKITVLHAVSSYPANLEECNLSAISRLRLILGVKLGWSDHTVQESVINSAVLRHAADMIEMHLDLDGKGFEGNIGHCWLPDRAKNVIQSLKEADLAEGSGQKEPTENERRERLWRADPGDGLRPMRKTRETLEKS